MFTGNIYARIDEKGRTPFPASFRKLLEEGTRLIVTKDIYENCIRVQTEASRSEEKVRFRSNLNEFDRQDRYINRLFNLNVHELSLDASGRILIPKTLIEMCQIHKDVVFVGMDDYIEIWSKESLEGISLPPEDLAEMMSSAFGKKISNLDDALAEK